MVSPSAILGGSPPNDRGEATDDRELRPFLTILSGSGLVASSGRGGEPEAGDLDPGGPSRSAGPRGDRPLRRGQSSSSGRGAGGLEAGQPRAGPAGQAARGAGRGLQPRDGRRVRTLHGTEGALWFEPEDGRTRLGGLAPRRRRDPGRPWPRRWSSPAAGRRPGRASRPPTDLGGRAGR